MYSRTVGVVYRSSNVIMVVCAIIAAIHETFF